MKGYKAMEGNGCGGNQKINSFDFGIYYEWKCMPAKHRFG